MSREEFLKSMHDAVTAFGLYYRLRQIDAEDKDQWPDDMSRADWEEQLAMWLENHHEVQS